MRAFGPLLYFTLLAATPSFAVPVVASRPTGDPWEVGFRTPTAPCESIRSEVAFVVPPAKRERAIEMLTSVSVRALDERQAADLLRRSPSANLLSDLLVPQVDKLEAQRTAALIHHEGSWSDADTITVSDLVTMMQTHYPPYRPYLVRAFSGDRPTPWDYFDINLCGTSLQVSSLTAGDRALRTPLVVFLQSAPATVEPVWFPGPATEGGRPTDPSDRVAQ
ncbi:MAG TPA: hypothetical protein VHS81_03625 [Caulobacteraceae bacterium]|jgi:hypothetical protein|nr:hypothetical protein [Caulobacteraceae bacterium]